MRREFILVLLGIICVSTLSSLLSDYVQIDSDRVHLDTVVGIVGAGNFSYWQLGHTGPLLVELTSLTGDADLYVSDSIRPSYEIDRNNFSSETCGTDTVKVPVDFPRPIGIGVFGHWSHSLSEYSIQVFLDRGARAGPPPHHPAGGAEIADVDRRVTEKQPARKTEEDNKPRFLKLLSILDMIFEMFVL